MNSKMRLSFQKWDILPIILVLGLALMIFVAFLPQKSAAGSQTVEIYQDGQLKFSLPLNTDQTIRIDGAYTSIIQIQGRTASVIKSDCPGNDCVHTGKISRSGQSIVCLPNRVEIRIVGPSDVDFVVG